MLFKVCDEAHLIEPCYSQGSPFFFYLWAWAFTNACLFSLFIDYHISSVWCLSSLWFAWRLSLDGGAIQGEKATCQRQRFHNFEKKCWNTMMCMCVRKGICDFPWKLWKLVCLNVKGFPQGYLTPSFHFFLQSTFLFSFVSHRNARAHRSARFLYFS